MKNVERTDKEKWEDVTESEIRNNKKRQCVKCVYFRTWVGNAIVTGICDYISIKGHSRGCRPDQCDKFKPKKRMRKQTV